jgi:hypothetical protein
MALVFVLKDDTIFKKFPSEIISERWCCFVNFKALNLSKTFRLQRVLEFFYGMKSLWAKHA